MMGIIDLLVALVLAICVVFIGRIIDEPDRMRPERRRTGFILGAALLWASARLIAGVFL